MKALNKKILVIAVLSALTVSVPSIAFASVSHEEDRSSNENRSSNEDSDSDDSENTSQAPVEDTEFNNDDHQSGDSHHEDNDDEHHGNVTDEDEHDEHHDDEHEHVAETPIPAAMWLFGSGLAGLFGFRRKQ